MDWIKIENVKPEFEKKVLIFNGEINVAMLVCDAENKTFFSDREYDHGCGFVQYINVSHWMPLPSFPS